MTPDLAEALHLAEPSGALVASVVDGSPALKAGLKPGDVIIEYDGRRIAESDTLPRAVAETAIGREVPLTVVRDGKRVRLAARITELEEVDRPAALDSAKTPGLSAVLQALTPEVARGLGLDETHGVLVRRVEPDGAAASAGLRAGDVIIEVDHRPVQTLADLRRLVECTGTPLRS